MECREAPTNKRLKILMLGEKGKVLIEGSVLPNLFLTAVMTFQSDDQRDTVEEAFSILTKAA